MSDVRTALLLTHLRPAWATDDRRPEKYGWLNRIIAVGLGHREPQGPIYRVFEVL